MATQKPSFRVLLPRLMQNIQILYQNGEISTNEKNDLCQMAKQALQSNELESLHSRFKTMRYGSLLVHVVEDCIQITS